MQCPTCGRDRNSADKSCWWCGLEYAPVWIAEKIEEPIAAVAARHGLDPTQLYRAPVPPQKYEGFTKETREWLDNLQRQQFAMQQQAAQQMARDVWAKWRATSP